DRLRTGALVGAVAAAAALVVIEGFGSGNANDDVPPIDNPEKRPGPVVRIRLPVGFRSPGRSTSGLSCCSVHNERNEGLPGRCADSWQKGGRYRPATLPAMEPQTVLCALLSSPGKNVQG